MNHTNNVSEPDIEAQLRRLLTRYAEGMPSETSVEARVRSALATRPQQRQRSLHLPSWGEMGGWARGAVSLALVVALLVTFAAVLRLRANSTSINKTPCPIVQAQGMIKLCPNQHMRVSINIGQTYADPTRTVALIQINPKDLALPLGHEGALIQPNAIFCTLWASLVDSQGHVYYSNDLSNYTEAQGGGLSTAEYAEFDPLPPSMLSAPQTLTLRIPEIVLTYPLSESHTLGTLILRGQWTATVQVTPQVGRSIALSVAPQTRNGITVQPLRLDIGPQGSQFDLLTGGERLTLRISGLPADTYLYSVANMPHSYTRSDGGGGGGGVPTSSLTFEGREPASLAVVGAIGNASPSAVPTVGPTGTLDLEVIFLSPPLPKLTGTQKLTISAINVGPPQVVKGPWIFEVPLG
jgi:hypothetical protein